jgi:hypothetical protein
MIAIRTNIIMKELIPSKLDAKNVNAAEGLKLLLRFGPRNPTDCPSPANSLSACAAHRTAFRISPRPISIRQLHALLHFHLEPIYLVAYKGSYILGNLILRGASRLDAFSAYPFHT